MMICVIEQRLPLEEGDLKNQVHNLDAALDEAGMELRAIIKELRSTPGQKARG